MNNNFDIIDVTRTDEKTKAQLPAKLVAYKGETLALFVGDNLDQRAANYVSVYGYLAEWRYRNIVASYVKRNTKNAFGLNGNHDKQVDLANQLYELQYGSLRRFSKKRLEFLKTIDPELTIFLIRLSDGSVVERSDSTDAKIVGVVNKQQ